MMRFCLFIRPAQLSFLSFFQPELKIGKARFLLFTPSPIARVLPFPFAFLFPHPFHPLPLCRALSPSPIHPSPIAFLSPLLLSPSPLSFPSPLPLSPSPLPLELKQFALPTRTLIHSPGGVLPTPTPLERLLMEKEGKEERQSDNSSKPSGLRLNFFEFL